MSIKLDILFFGAHPDDVELACGGTILKHVAEGKLVGIVDLTRGELGTRGSAELRDQEAQKAGEILGIKVRANLGLADGKFVNNEESQLKVIEAIRRYKPEVVVTNAPSDRHPDHGRACDLVKEACFYSGLAKIETKVQEINQEPWRPGTVYHYIQDYYHEPDIVIDVTPFWEKRMEAVLAYKSQFYDPNNQEPETPISSKEFQDYLKARAIHFGRAINARYAEGFLTTTPLKVEHL